MPLRSPFGPPPCSLRGSELRGQTDHDLARHLLLAAFRLRDAIERARNPFLSSGEMSHAVKAEGLVEQHHDEVAEHPWRNSTAVNAVYAQRWGKVQTAFQELDSGGLEAEVLWGKQGARVRPAASELVRDLLHAIEMYLELKRDAEGFDKDSIKRVKEIVHGRRDDPFAKRVDVFVETVESLVRPKLHHHGR